MTTHIRPFIDLAIENLKSATSQEDRDDILLSVDFTATPMDQRVQLMNDCGLSFNQKAGLMHQLEIGERLTTAAEASSASLKSAIEGQHEILRQQTKVSKARIARAEEEAWKTPAHTDQIKEGLQSTLVTLSYSAAAHFEEVMWLNDKPQEQQAALIEKTALISQQLQALSQAIMNGGKVRNAELQEIRDRAVAIAKFDYPDANFG